ncbi:4279_t:CDS:2 [Acaulospora morrowiae]|uniref:4279_t:CDS:1 n=1 Tax=Acaulospora morrowiae TaxID=94023 RepID=A0A9N8V8G7_9GLOM|nr:4279_t:CDS:2 [Acaulospora morrowiae]
MLLTSLLESGPIFSIRLINKEEESMHVANVTTHTTGKILLLNYKRCIFQGDYKLIYNDKDIQLSDTLKELGIKKGNIVYVAPRRRKNSNGSKRIEFDFTPDKPRSSMTIFLKTPSKKTELEVYWSDTISHIKNMIHNLEGISPQKQIVTFNDIELEGHYTLSYYNIQKESTLYLTYKEMIIYIRMETGETIEHESTPPDNSIHKIKSMIEDKKHIPFAMQRITFNGKELYDDCILPSYEIKNRSVINLEIKSMIFVKKNTGLIINIDAETKETIKQIKQKILEKEFLPVEQLSLFFLNKELCDQNTLSYYDIQNGSTLDLGYKEIKIFVNAIDGKVIELRVKRDYKVETIKKMIQDKEGIPYHQQYLFFHDLMQDHEFLSSCYIREGSTLRLEYEKMTINVNLMGKKIIKLGVEKNFTIEQVRRMIEEKEGISLNQVHLEFSNNILFSEKTLISYHVTNESTLDLCNNYFSDNDNVYVVLLSGKKINLSVESTNTISDLKLKLYEKEKIPHDQQRLIYGRKQLENHRLLSDYPIERESLIHLVLALRGGMFQETSGRNEFNALPSLTQYTITPEERLSKGIHAGIVCNYCRKREWKGMRYKCSECLDYDLCFDCIKMSNLLHNVQHHFLKLTDPVDPKATHEDILSASVNIFPILPDTKEKLLTLLREEERRRLSPEMQRKYYEVGNDPTCGMDWMDVTDQMQHELVREFGYSDEAVQLLRRAPQLYPNDPEFHTTQVYVRNNIANIGNLTEGMSAPDCSLIPLEPSMFKTMVINSNTNSPNMVSLRLLYKSGRPLVLFGGSYTCPLYRYISHVLNDIYTRYKAQVDFYMIQIREAHASDVWPIGNIVDVKEHRTLSDRLTAAREMVEKTQLKIPVLADTMDDSFLKLYSPWPFRFFIVIDGILKLVGMPKVAHYDTTDLVKCLDDILCSNRN